MDPCFDSRQTELLSHLKFGENAKLLFSAFEILLQMGEDFFKQTKFFEMEKWHELSQNYKLIKEKIFGLEKLVKDYFIESNEEIDRERMTMLNQNLERLEKELKHKNEEIAQLKTKIENLNEEKRNCVEIEENIKNKKERLNQDCKGKIQQYSKWKYLLMLTTFPIFILTIKYLMERKDA